MKLLVDAQLPKRLANMLRAAGHDVVHTLELPDGNRTHDQEICDISLRDQRVVITKDADFVNSFVLAGAPFKLLLVSTGNIDNAELELLFARNLKEIEAAFESHAFVEIDRRSLMLHM